MIFDKFPLIFEDHGVAQSRVGQKIKLMHQLVEYNLASMRLDQKQSSNALNDVKETLTPFFTGELKPQQPIKKKRFFKKIFG